MEKNQPSIKIYFSTIIILYLDLHPPVHVHCVYTTAIETDLLNVSLTTTPQFGNSSISTIIEWTPEEGVIYEAVAVPEPAALTFLTRSRIRVILFYNTQYNITIVTILCSQNSTRVFETTAVSLSYGEDLS